MKIYSYVITHDTGFAPNPFHGVLTLATCKPKIRKKAKIGDILLGTGSASSVGNKTVVYAAIISDVLSIEDYFIDKRFQSKKPTLKNEWFYKHGDNIYQKKGDKWLQKRNMHHFKSDIVRDVSGENVLVCKHFWYFGKKALRLPNKFHPIVKKGPGHKITCDKDTILQLMDWLKLNSMGIKSLPFTEDKHCGSCSIA